MFIDNIEQMNAFNSKNICKNIPSWYDLAGIPSCEKIDFDLCSFEENSRPFYKLSGLSLSSNYGIAINNKSIPTGPTISMSLYQLLQIMEESRDKSADGGGPVAGGGRRACLFTA